MPIAIHQSDANEQHYEVPSDFYLKFMGPYMKYSCGYWPNENTTLNESETIMLDMYCERAQLENGNIVWKNVNLLSLKKFRQINSLVTSLVNTLFSRNFCHRHVTVKFRNFHSVVWKLLQFSLTHFWQKFRENNVFTKEITKELI